MSDKTHKDEGFISNIEVSPQSDGILVEWSRQSGVISGFIIYLGQSYDNLEEYTRIPRGFKKSYFEKITDIEKDREYYVSVVPYKDEEVLNISDPPISVVFGVVKKQTNNRDQEIVVQESTNEVSVNAVDQRSVIVCGYCKGIVSLDENEQIFICQSCRECYVQRVTNGDFVSITKLKNGICKCCKPRRPLIKLDGDEYKTCSNSGERYADMGQDVILLSELDYGLCTCCKQPKPLILNHQGQVVCSSKLDHLYIEKNGRYVYVKPENPTASVDDIDKALAEGTAVMGPNGIIMNK